MILKRGVKIQLIAFLIITVLGVSVVAVRYVGLGRGLLGQEYTAYVDLTDSGGVFTNAEVTYRGVPVGRVGPIELTDTGIRVKLKLKSSPKIPYEGTTAVVANRSAVGEQYIDLQPSKPVGQGGKVAGPYLSDGGRYSTIKRENTKLPVSTAELLRNVDRLVSSVNPKHLGTIVDELELAFSGSAADLQKILDDSDRLLKTAEESYPATAELLDNSAVVLNTQRNQAGHILNFARNLNELTGQIRRDDPALRDTLDATAPVAREAGRLIDDLAPTLPVLLANLTTTGQIMTSRISGLRSLLILYPIAVAGSFTVTPGDGTQHLGLVLNLDKPAVCTKGYEKVKKRWPQFTGKTPTPLDIGCKEPKNSEKVVRGARNLPTDAIGPTPKVPPGATDGAGFPAGGAYGGTPQSGSDNRSGKKPQAAGSPAAPADPGASSIYVPISTNSVQLAGYDPSTGAVYGPDGKKYIMGHTGGQERLLGDASWKMLLLGPLSR